MLRLGDVAPEFEASCLFPGDDHLDTKLVFSKFCENSWVILFSHPADFTPVCTTELAKVNLLSSEWKSRGCKVIGLSTDRVENHLSWSKDICDYAGELSRGDTTSTTTSVTCSSKLNFPIIADFDLKVSTLYGMLDQECHDPSNIDEITRAPLPIRTVFILDPKRRVRLTMTYPAAVGRSFTEILRCLDALQRSDQYKIATPADWKQGENVIVRFDVKDEEADLLFPDRKAFKPYLRFTFDPRN